MVKLTIQKENFNARAIFMNMIDEKVEEIE